MKILKKCFYITENKYRDMNKPHHGQRHNKFPYVKVQLNVYNLIFLSNGKFDTNEEYTGNIYLKDFLKFLSKCFKI